ncbi:MAG: hypothetical protein LC794_15410 [Acidobacteria bacterium]|nr:hypothetical protein [Acidobacteriota bacterium]
MAAALAVLVPLPLPLIIVPVTAAIFALQVWGLRRLRSLPRLPGSS